MALFILSIQTKSFFENINVLADKATMSRVTFLRSFKETMLNKENYLNPYGKREHKYLI